MKIMKITRRMFCCLSVLFFIACNPNTQSVQARTVRLFVIGNSFSENATRFLPELARDGGHKVVLGRAEINGAPLQAHWEAVAAAEKNPDDPKGKPYGGKSLRDLLGSGVWDIVTIQQASIVSASVSTYQPYAGNLRDYIKKLQPQAEVVIHQTWAYRSDARKFSAVDATRTAQTQQEMWEESRKSYRRTAGELGVRLIPVGDAFWKVSSDSQWGYKKDATYDFDKPVFPLLPDQTNSLYGGYWWVEGKDGTENLSFDANHANTAGCYLAALVWYGFLFDESPEKLAFTPKTVPVDFGKYLRQVAWQTVKESAAKPAL